MDLHILNKSLTVFVIILLMVTLMVIISRMFGIKAKGSMFAPMILSSFIATMIYGIWLADGIVKLGLGDHVFVHAFVFSITGVLLYIPIIFTTARILKPGGKTTS